MRAIKHSSSPVSSLGRRERKRELTRQAVYDAAVSLFVGHDADAVTTQQIADSADVSIGTVFNYAATKNELFLMAYNSVFADAITAGGQQLDGDQPPATTVDALHALLRPLLELCHGSDRANLLRYHRELLFSDSNDRYRLQGIELVSQLERSIARILLRGLGSTAASVDDAPQPLADTVRSAARAVWAAVQFSVAMPEHTIDENVRFADADEATVIRQIDIIVRGLKTTAAYLPGSTSTS
ncbi:TetR/AcrR family transcriptional regulator [Corynebacterium falsenii]|uniref:TetR/AcrR family transcriptional regulator n=1 Tax=Corynebacterium falsenii TaxID=108486 RepID=UPI001DC4F15C|nr:TetR/AcrR family transcriptional regulator [Corynebacterium falsenii]HJF12844.1 TetR/AcrR family transcriptional regulator [Corynebacterium falsenii]